MSTPSQQTAPIYADLQKEIYELRRWKEEQMQIESSWNEQAVGKLLDLPLGSAIRPQIEGKIKGLQEALSGRTVSCSQCNESARTIEELREQLDSAKNELAACSQDLSAVLGALLHGGA